MDHLKWTSLGVLNIVNFSERVTVSDLGQVSESQEWLENIRS